MIVSSNGEGHRRAQARLGVENCATCWHLPPTALNESVRGRLTEDRSEDPSKNQYESESSAVFVSALVEPDVHSFTTALLLGVSNPHANQVVSSLLLDLKQSSPAAKY